MAREAIERLVDYDDWFLRDVDKGLAEVERGQTLSHEKVGARVEKRLARKQSACWCSFAAPDRGLGSQRYNHSMSIKVAYRDGVFEPLEKVEGAQPGAIYTAFSEDELRDFLETLGWLKAAEKSFDFWNNPADAAYDTL